MQVGGWCLYARNGRVSLVHPFIPYPASLPHLSLTLSSHLLLGVGRRWAWVGDPYPDVDTSVPELRVSLGRY